jgi:glycine betaine/proline transport system ATP-binding protein
LRSNKKRSAFVVDKSQKLLGVIRESGLEKLLELEDRPKVIPQSSIQKVTTVNEDTILEDLFSIVSENPYAIPVLNEKGRFAGIVTTDQIFDSISPSEGAENV